MKIIFDPNQQYQIDAVNAVIDVFDGQPLADSDYSITFAQQNMLFQSELGVGNNLILDEDQLLNNVQKVQQEFGIEKVTKLLGRNFSIEMETGTGKTYVYLRTIFELNNKYGFKKYAIVVPSP